MTAVDTNILFYAHDPRDLAKQQIASSLIESLDDGVLLWQVACEYLWASRKLESLGYHSERAYSDITDLRRVWKTVRAQWGALDRARTLQSGYGFAFWDALIVATCLEAGVHTLISEDLHRSEQIEALRITNPFV